MTNYYNLVTINDFTYSLKINGDYYNHIYYSIQKLVKTAHFDHETNTIIFSAENVKPFKQCLLEQKNKTISHLTCIRLIDNITKQMLYLKNMGFGFYGFDINDILTIDNTFILCSTQYMLPLYDESFIFTSPIKHPYFSSPELFELTSLPFEVSYKCCHYSLGLLVVFSLLNIYLLVGNELKSSEEIDKILEPLYNTKIYWFLKRCLDDDINNRKLLLV